MVEENPPVRDAAEKIEPEIAALFWKCCLNFHEYRFVMRPNEKRLQRQFEPDSPTLSPRFQRTIPELAVKSLYWELALRILNPVEARITRILSKLPTPHQSGSGTGSFP
jgi:hypothetical protein